MLIKDLDYFKKSSNYTSNISGLDKSGNNYYRYNSWGFRGPEYQKGKTVYICLGDSFTVNIGCTIENSWPSLLNLPTVNLGMDGAGNDSINLLYNRANEVFNVKGTFVMYSFLHRRLVDGKFKQYAYEDQENFDYFLQNRIEGAIECALPSWCWSDSEYEFLKGLGIYFLDIPDYGLFSDYPNIDRTHIYKEAYNNLRGSDWPTYNSFIAGAPSHPDMFTKEFGLFCNPQRKYKNSDGFHLSKYANCIYSNYLIQQEKQKNES